MAHRKRRSMQQMMEDGSLAIIRSKLPEEWVMHDYKPDFGIDLVVEVFERLKENPKVAETLGEQFFVQAKSEVAVKVEAVKVYPRGNVAKGELREDRSEFKEVEVIKFNIDVSELLTVRAMGAGVSVLLFLVCLKTQRLFFVCLNDLIDKVIDPEDPTFGDQETKTIYIPVKNEITTDGMSLVPLRFYARRAKLYSAFSKFYYQYNELRQRFDLDMLLHFIQQIKGYDFWETSEYWEPIADMHKRVLEVESVFQNAEACDPMTVNNLVLPVWHGLCNLNNMHEELCREWFLPTFLAQLTSYPS